MTARDATYKGRTYRIYRCACRTCPQAVACRGRSKRDKDLWQQQWSATEAAHRAKMQTAAARAIYRRRAQTVEPVFGQWKTLSRFTRLLLRGGGGAQIEAWLVASSHNLRKCLAHWRTIGMCAWSAA